MKSISMSILENINTPQYLSSSEYISLCKQFADSLNEQEINTCWFYTVGNFSIEANEDNGFKRSYRIKNDKTKRGYSIKKASIADIVKDDSIYLDKELNSKSIDGESADFNYTKFTLARDEFKKLDKIFKNKGIVLNKDILVHRKGHETIEQITNGRIRYGYTSTSAKSRINKITGGDLRLGDKEFDIVVPAGMPMLFLEPFANDDIKKQHEILLPRNLRFELVTHELRNGKDYFYVIARL